MSKTQSQIEARLKAYAKGNVDSPYRIKKPTSYDARFGKMEVGAIDADQSFHAQCMDLIVDYMLWLTDNKTRMWGDAKQAIQNTLPSGYKVVPNKPKTIPKTGWIAVYTTGSYAQYGHIGIVNNPGNTTKFQILEQNWNNLANKKPQLRWDNYYGLTHFITVPYTEEKKKSVKKETAKKKTTTKKKPFKLKYNRDEVKGYKLPKRGYKPKGIVIHNDASSLTAEQWRNALVNAPLSTLERGIAHSYISNGYVYQALPEGRVAWHTANNDGNKNYYGIEVCQSMRATDKQFLENEQQAFQEAARMLKKWKLPVNRNTVRLHNEFSATECPHRSMALHAGYKSSMRAPQAVVNKTKDYFISQIKAYYNGKIPTGSTVSSSKTTTSTTNNIPSGWKTNNWGILYKAEHASFTPTVDFIYTRSVGPSRQNPIAGQLYRGQTINYSEVQKFDSHVWVSWKTNAGITVYMPIRTWNAQTGKMGPFWGVIK
ncbi:N-acetylmuramoyl-L-alanine amidase [Mammaliicoccus lentus]|uniref:N-acetylmuramoyl-L-alanine amidase n=1 Tax=Mammaliicoccus lentus TaxID=42858 RepID=UPI001071B781|nr:N-acetylmuramoyl-L-alanine amidase [Mammaliicoccus lentus]MBF0793822.1 N-acetylmuramoyl-L-alanine amidase [Mammaliicoccus lentus]TFV17121.1 CHAP domain-containing protein [Mammaliicoccus lentus]